jgi:hypothetical protein
MDIGKSLQYTFEDERWASKLGIGALIGMVPVLNIAWSGYMIEIIRRVVAGHDQPLPEWDDLGARFMDGLYLFLAAFVYGIPAFLLFGLPFGIMVIPALIENQDAQGIVALFTTTVGLALLCFFFLYIIALSLIFPAVQLNYAQSGTFQSCFQLRKIFQLIAKNSADYLIAWLVASVLSFVVITGASLIGGIVGWVPCLGQLFGWVVVIIATVWCSAVASHLYGQIGKKAFAETATPTASEG